MIEQPVTVAPGLVAIEELRLLESCSFSWIFDEATHLFRRLPRDATVSLEVPAPWARYHRLEVDKAGAWFVVELDERRTRILRAWLHADPCTRCRRGNSRPTRSGRYRFRPFGGWTERRSVA